MNDLWTGQTFQRNNRNPQHPVVLEAPSAVVGLGVSWTVFWLAVLGRVGAVVRGPLEGLALWPMLWIRFFGS